ncbi:unnamed protein product [Ceutorhynchus assimilis]|uniref:UDP-glucuronosyltransferase n=1 Tax=Ceutorhynchus assimilis TaxID=467358 RepID=A0A9N9MN23_9CUCU|nr:unnamed protein product [Ceutorhynchus assimilis]
MFFNIFLVLFSILHQCLASNILAVFIFPGISHFMMFQPLLKELANRGHNVDVVSHFPSTTPIERYTDISIRGLTQIVTNNLTFSAAKDCQGQRMIKMLAREGGSDLCDTILKSPILQKLKNSTKNYDLVITQLFSTECMLGWGWHFGVPNVVLTSSVNLPWASERFGLPDNPAYVPNYFGKSGTVMNLHERIVNTWLLVISKLIYYLYSTQPSNRIAKEFFGKDMPDLDILAYNTSLHLINTHVSIHTSRPLPPNVIEVSGLHIMKPKPLNEHLNKTLTTDKKGIICFSLGSIITSETTPDSMMQAMFDAFSELPYKVIWKAKRENFSKILKVPDNIHFEAWLPQLDILCDPRVKLFVSHGGMLGSQEAVYCGVPMLMIPYVVDQHLNSKESELMGYALKLDSDKITKETMLLAMKKLLDEPIYKQTMNKVSDQFRDRPLSAMDTAIYWIEYVIRHQGAPHLQSPIKNLYWYQYYLLDVVAVSIGIPLVLLILCIKLLKNRIGCTKGTKMKVKTK